MVIFANAYREALNGRVATTLTRVSSLGSERWTLVPRKEFRGKEVESNIPKLVYQDLDCTAAIIEDAAAALRAMSSKILDLTVDQS